MTSSTFSPNYNPIFQTTNRFDQLSSVKAVTTSNVAGTYSNGSGNNGVGSTLTMAVGTQTFDSYSPNAGDRILLAGQTAGLQNGIYVVTTVGTSSAATVLTRSGDFQSIDQMNPGKYVICSNGSANKGTIWVLTSSLSQVGVSTITFVNAATGSANGGIKAGVTSAYGGGGTSNAFTVTGMTATSIVTANILASNNSVSINKVIPSANTLTIIFSADPGVGTVVQYHYV